jgi:glycosyltransferase involved in cell wall biosynthesis
MQTDLPLVSILMTAYNREKYIAEAIESILASTYSNFELIIVDDSSSDNTVLIAKNYAKKDSRVRVYCNDINLGDYPNRNNAASYAQGKYIKYVDSDDKLFDFSLQYCVDQMEKYPEASIGLLFLNITFASEDSLCWESEKIVRSHFFGDSCLSIGPSGSIIRREKFEEIGGFDTRFGVASDNYFNIKLAALFPVVLLPKVFLFYREHEGQQQHNQKGYLKFGYLYFKELLQKTPLPLTKNEIHYLNEKLQKRFAINLTKYLIKTKDIKSVSQIMKETNFSFSELILGFFK